MARKKPAPRGKRGAPAAAAADPNHPSRRGAVLPPGGPLIGGDDDKNKVPPSASGSPISEDHVPSECVFPECDCMAEGICKFQPEVSVSEFPDLGVVRAAGELPAPGSAVLSCPVGTGRPPGSDWYHAGTPASPGLSTPAGRARAFVGPLLPVSISGTVSSHGLDITVACDDARSRDVIFGLLAALLDGRVSS